MNAKTETKTTMYKWTACNPYNYLNGVVEARTLLGAVRAGRKYVEGEVELLNYFGFETFVDEVRYRRAACRTWMDVYKRNCENCKYFSRGKTEEPCVECSELYDAGIPEYWEPKKEEKNETDA